MLRLKLAGPHTTVTSSLCARCPHSPAGCCVAPPRYDWSDIGRVVTLGGRSWLVEQLALGHLQHNEHGLTLQRLKGRALPQPDSPRITKCVFHDGRSGCTIPESRRPATCNFYVCESALTEGERDGANADRVREAHDATVASFVRWDASLTETIRARWPEGPPYDDAFFAWLGDAFSRLVDAHGGSVSERPHDDRRDQGGAPRRAGRA